jgi:hypothetical protein
MNDQDRSMNLPNGVDLWSVVDPRAIIPIEKLTGYCLNPHHAKGKHKARLFKAVLNLTIDDADILYALIQKAAISGEVIQQDSTPKGKILKVDWEIPNTGGRQLRTTWEIAHTADIPRLITAFIKRAS